MFCEGGGGEIFGSSHNACGEIQPLLPTWITRLDSRSLYGPSIWLAALSLDQSDQYVLVALTHSNLQRIVVHGTAGQLLSSLLRQMLRQATCTKSLGTQESAATAANDATPEAGARQSTVDSQPEQMSVGQ